MRTGKEELAKEMDQHCPNLSNVSIDVFLFAKTQNKETFWRQNFRLNLDLKKAKINIELYYIKIKIELFFFKNVI